MLRGIPDSTFSGPIVNADRGSRGVTQQSWAVDSGDLFPRVIQFIDAWDLEEVKREQRVNPKSQHWMKEQSSGGPGGIRFD